jgi:hypothetical protein
MTSSKLPHVQIDLPGAFVVQQRRLERLIRLLRPLFELEEPAHIEVDMSKLVSIGPTALALLIAALRRVDEAEFIGEDSALIPPNSPQVKNYLMRMNLIRSLIGGEHLHHEAAACRKRRLTAGTFRLWRRILGIDR